MIMLTTKFIQTSNNHLNNLSFFSIGVTLRSLIDGVGGLVGVVGKVSKTNSRGGCGGGGFEKTENFKSRRGWLLNCFFRSFSNHENYSIKNISVYSKSKIKTKVTNKQNLQHFKMINRRLFIHMFCNNSSN